jgi:hypothetical protein
VTWSSLRSWPDLSVAFSGSGRSVRRAARAYSEQPLMPSARALVTVTFLLLACASCSQQDNDSAASPPRPATSAPSSPAPSIPSDLAKYAPNERAAYANATRAYSAFTRWNSQFLANGQTIKAASDFYHRYSIDWVEAWANLAELANNHVTVKGRTRIVWVHPVRINLAASGLAVVVLSRCLDESRLKVRQAGTPLAQPQLEHPHVYQVRLVKRVNEVQWRSGTAKRGATC